MGGQAWCSPCWGTGPTQCTSTALDSCRPCAGGLCLEGGGGASARPAGATEIILATGAADGREVTIPVQVEFDLALAPPARVIKSPSHVGSSVPAATLDAIENGETFLVGQGLRAPELSVQVGRFRGYIAEGIVDLVELGAITLQTRYKRWEWMPPKLGDRILHRGAIITSTRCSIVTFC